MSPVEIQIRIKKNNELIERYLNPSQFVLNNEVRKLLKENEELQKQCPHQFEDGYCVFCLMEEPKGND